VDGALAGDPPGVESPRESQEPVRSDWDIAEAALMIARIRHETS